MSRPGKAAEGWISSPELVIDEAEGTTGQQLPSDPKSTHGGRQSYRDDLERGIESGGLGTMKESEDAVIRCICGATIDEAGWKMTWQHSICMDWPEEEVDEDFYCKRCLPISYVELLEAMERGEKPW